jgi:hypothetical protein
MKTGWMPVSPGDIQCAKLRRSSKYKLKERAPMGEFTIIGADPNVFPGQRRHSLPHAVCGGCSSSPCPLWWRDGQHYGLAVYGETLSRKSRPNPRRRYRAENFGWISPEGVYKINHYEATS